MSHTIFSKLTTHLTNKPGLARWLTIGLLTACACLVTVISLPDFSTIESFAEQDSQISMTDFYERAAAHSGVVLLDTTVTIIAIDDCSHDDIAEIIDLVSDCQPKAIGLDLVFYSLDNDSLLKSSLKNASSLLTLPATVGESLPSQVFVNSDTLPEARFARVDLAQEHRAVPIRRYFLSVDGQPSFVRQLALSAGYDISDLDETEPLRYGARDFDVISAREMLDDGIVPAEEINDKIILIGTVDDYNDMHYTPVDNDMPGIKIHAYSLSTLISGQPVKSFPLHAIYAIALLFTAATVWLCMRVDGLPSANLVSRIIPLGIILIFIYICYHCYNTGNLYIDFTIVLAMTASGMLCYDIYTGLPYIIQVLWRHLFNKK